jgi:tRNA(Ile)-lysidine synthase
MQKNGCPLRGSSSSSVEAKLKFMGSNIAHLKSAAVKHSGCAINNCERWVAVFTLIEIMGVMQLQQSPPATPCMGSQPLLAVAYSGGADSTTLLLETLRQYPHHTVAFHIHHGIQAAADSFVRHCEGFCTEHQVPLYVAYVNAKNAPGESPEDAARSARYAALVALATTHGVAASGGKVLLAQHADDQIETLLLALSRGAGLGGLAAMPARFLKAGVWFERPMLARSAASIRTWLKTEGISYIEDPTNANRSLTRNKIRLDVLPALQSAFPQCRQTVGRSIAHIAQANDLLSDLARIDLLATGQPPRIAHLQGLAQNRQVNVLRYWLNMAHSAIPSTAQLNELIKQLSACRTRGHRIYLKIASGFVSRQGDALRYNDGL